MADSFSIPGSSIPGSSTVGPQFSAPGTGTLASPSSAQTGGRGGGGNGLGARKKAEEDLRRKNAEFEKDKAEYNKRFEKEGEPEAGDENAVKLSRPAWDRQQGVLGEKSRISVQAVVPDHLKHLTRIVFSLFALGPKGDKESLGRKEAHLKEGKAETEFDLPYTRGKNAANESKREFVCEARHRHSQPVESAGFTAKARVKAENELVLEFEDAEEVKKSGWVFSLKSADGSLDCRISAKDGTEKDGFLTLRFEELRENLRYTLEAANEAGKVLERIFVDRAFGEWWGKE